MGRGRIIEKTTIDHQTGEILQSQFHTVSANNERFIMARTTDGLDWMKGLSGGEIHLIFEMCLYSNQETGFISTSIEYKKVFAEKIGKNVVYISELLASLVKKELIVRISRGTYMIKPNIYIGKSGEYKTKLELFNKHLNKTS